MSRSMHASYAAADRYERKASRRRAPRVRRTATRAAVVLAEIRQGY